MNDAKPQMAFECIEIAVPVKEFMPVLKAKRRDERVYRLAYSKTVSLQISVVFCCCQSEPNTTGLEDG